MIFFSADTHFGHENIIKYCLRPFKNVDHMDKSILNNFNQRLKPTDTLYLVGDFCFTNSSNKGEGTRNKWFYYYDQINCNKVLLRGNHDKNNRVSTNMINCVIRLHKKDIFLTHRPSDIVYGYDLYLVGHVHEKWKHKVYNDGIKNNLLINVGVDVWDFKPIKFEEILHYIRTIKNLI